VRPIRVLVVDDHALVRHGLVRLLATLDGVEVVGAAEDGESAIRLAAETRPDVVLLDLSMPRLDGMSALPRLREVAPASRVLVLSMHDEPEYAQAAVQMGASGLVSKAASSETLSGAIRAVAAGKTLEPEAGLTPREEEVLSLVAFGRKNEEIARALGIQPKTVEHHCGRLMSKLGVRTRAGLVAHARRIGLRPPAGS
jgi:DNA-binding NarL/FixJ family response regulator